MRTLINKRNYIPVLLTFFVMGFCDVVGTATAHMKEDFALTETLAGFIPSMVFIWFLILSVPSALLMNKFGRKTMVQVSNIITIVGMLIPFFAYNFVSCMIAFILLGVGNTILQVSLNPLLTNVVNGEKLTSCLTVGQVVKAISSLCGAPIAIFAASVIGEWRFLFPIYAIITVLAWALLATTNIEKEAPAESGTSVRSAFGLLLDPKILLFFLGIFFVVGVDVGTNTVAPKLLSERCGFSTDSASLGSSVYFFCRTIGAFLGSFLLAKIDEIKYLKVNILFAVASIALLYFVKESSVAIMVGIGGIGFFCASVFSILFSQALKARPEKANEISGFMITAVCGGAIVTPLMGFASDAIGNQTGSLIVITVCLAYIVFCAFYAGRKNA